MYSFEEFQKFVQNLIDKLLSSQRCKWKLADLLCCASDHAGHSGYIDLCGSYVFRRKQESYKFEAASRLHKGYQFRSELAVICAILSTESSSLWARSFINSQLQLDANARVDLPPRLERFRLCASRQGTEFRIVPIKLWSVLLFHRGVPVEMRLEHWPLSRSMILQKFRRFAVVCRVC